jgi:hypothetical protein
MCSSDALISTYQGGQRHAFRRSAKRYICVTVPLRKTARRKWRLVSKRKWRARRDSNSRPSGSKPFDLLSQILPEEWLIERIQQVGATSCNLLSPSFIPICGIFAAVFCNLRYIFVTASRSSRTRQGASPVEPQRWVGSCKLLKLADCIIVTTFCRLNKRHSSPILNWDMSFSCFFCVVERTRRIGLVGVVRQFVVPDMKRISFCLAQALRFGIAG